LYARHAAHPVEVVFRQRLDLIDVFRPRIHGPDVGIGAIDELTLGVREEPAKIDV
jgi:hypothetical protein